MQRLLIGGLALMLCAVEYRTILRSGFVFQDAAWREACATNPPTLARLVAVRSLPRTGALASWCGQLALKQSALAFHLVNLGLHVAVSALVGILIMQLVQREMIGWVVGGLFLLHPLAIESAGYVASRGELLAALGVVLACVCALAGSWLGVLVSLIVGLLGKESAVVACVLVPLVLAMQHRLAPSLVVVGAGLLAAITLTIVKAWVLVGWPWALVLSWGLLQATAAMRLTLLALVPLGQTPVHDYRDVPLLVESACALAFIVTAIWAWRLRVTQPLIACGLGWIVLAILPRLLMPTPPSVFNEHQFYVPLIGFAILLADRFAVWGMA